MSQNDLAAVTDTLRGLQVTLVEAGSADVPLLPQQWQPILAECDPQTRLAAALALWNAPLLEALPQFAGALRTRFTDVRPCLADSAANVVPRVRAQPALLYLAKGRDGNPLCWIGLDPASFVEPKFWEHFPEPLQMFLRHVHAGFTSAGPIEFGPMHPRYMQTFAEMAGEPDGLADWDEMQEIASTRLLIVAEFNGGLVHYCVSPDLEADQLAIVFEGDIDPTHYGAALDEMLMVGLDE